ncbi:MAG: alpha-glucosidase [Phycisphaerales bacterium]|nr:alpha-glucosidase [Phycisphaerales bacterium]
MTTTRTPRLPRAHTLLPLLFIALLARTSLADPELRRFTPDGYDVMKAGASFALDRPDDITQDPPAGADVAPQFGKAPDGLYWAYIATDPGTSLYGTGEIAGSLLRNGRKTVCWNTDAYGYDETNPSLYQSHPWVLALREDGTSFGALADTSWKCEIDLTGGIRFTAPSGAGADDARGFPVWIVEGETPQEVMLGLARLIGTIEMPPRWALGYHQCRYSYNPEARVREIAAGFRDRDIPCDVIWMDIDYMDGYRVFTFDKAQFPDPARLNADLHADGFHTIWMIDPGIKAEPGYSIFDSGTAFVSYLRGGPENTTMFETAWVRNAAGKVYQGEVWPGWCVYPDYTRHEVRQWWADLYKPFLATGIDGVWNDMNEPAVFNVPSKTMPEDNRHEGGIWDGNGQESVVPPGPHLKYHNVYGMLMAHATRQGILAAKPDARPFVLTRASFIGGHRFAATWTGDNSAQWDDLEASISMILNLGLSGQPFSGPDIGGFNGNGPGSPEENGELFARWMGIGSLLPFARGHTGKGNIDKEPWAFGPEVEQTCKFALQRRYRLMPYLYTLFYESHKTGMPIARPLFFADPKDPALRSEDDAFLLGNDVLVVAKVTPRGDRAVAVPAGDWRRVEIVDGDLDDPNLPELYIREGAIVPLGPIVEHTGEEWGDRPLTLLVALDENGSAQGTLYDDFGDGWGLRNGVFNLLTITATTGADGQVNIEFTNLDGLRKRPDWRIEIVNVEALVSAR